MTVYPCDPEAGLKLFPAIITLKKFINVQSRMLFSDWPRYSLTILLWIVNFEAQQCVLVYKMTAVSFLIRKR